MNLIIKQLKEFPVHDWAVIADYHGWHRLGKDASNGVFVANTPCLDKLFNSPLFISLQAHGMAVGLPSDEDMGNSEVGHNALGSGRVFAQRAKLVDASIASREIFKTPLWAKLVAGPKKQNDFSSHRIFFSMAMSIRIFISFLLLCQCAQDGVQRLRLHVLLDGRDVGENSAIIH